MIIVSRGISTIALILGAMLSCTDAHAQQLDPTKLKVDFKDGAVIINGSKLSIPCEPKALFAILGKADRTSDLANTIHTWDNLGIHAYQTTGKNEINAIQVTLNRLPYDFAPKQLFRGTVMFAGKPITKGTTAETIEKAAAPNKLNKIGGSWNVSYGSTSLYFTEVDRNQKTADVILAAVQLCKSGTN